MFQWSAFTWCFECNCRVIFHQVQMQVQMLMNADEKVDAGAKVDTDIVVSADAGSDVSVDLGSDINADAA